MSTSIDCDESFGSDYDNRPQEGMFPTALFVTDHLAVAMTTDHRKECPSLQCGRHDMTYQSRFGSSRCR